MESIASLIRHSYDALDMGVMVLDETWRIVYANPAFHQGTGYTPEELSGQSPLLINPGWQAQADFAAVRKALSEKGRWRGEVWSRRKNGEMFSDQVTITALSESAAIGWAGRYVYSIASIGSEREKKLQQMAMYDELTNLPNRRLLQVHLEQAMLRSERGNTSLAVCMLDLDGFKPVNDTHGHESGDEVLVALGKRLRAALRKSDLVARVGGDEFVLIIEDILGQKDLEPLLIKVNDAISAPLRLANGALIDVGTSMGVVLHSHGEEKSGDQLLREADQALYVCKAHKHVRNRFWALAGEKADSIVPQQERKSVRLLEQGRVEVHYQPILSNKLNRIVGIEALARLRDDNGHLLMPSEFLPDLKHGYLTDLSRAVLTRSLADLGRLDSLNPENGIWLSFNVDPSSFGRDCVDCMRVVIEDSGISPRRITMEILESNDFIERERDVALAVLNQIKSLGVRLALDDVGSAYASLMRLKELPIDEMKLDQGFVRTLEARPQDFHFVRAIQDLVMELNVDLVVEGVETEDILDAMVTMGVAYMQGYAIAKPMPFDDLVAFLEQFVPDTAPHPKTLFGYYAGTMVSHGAIKKMFLINSSLMNTAILGDSHTCRGHLVQQRLGCGNEGHELERLHDNYHRAMGLALEHAGEHFRNLHWDQVEVVLEEFLNAMLQSWRAGKDANNL
jgi:diguanylate cyclase (GGDEF)-like protein/PAS domain S-box-containing protein